MRKRKRQWQNPGAGSSFKPSRLRPSTDAGKTRITTTGDTRVTSTGETRRTL